MDRELNDEELQSLFAWLDKIPLSRPKRHISRDFSDGVMAAELVKHFFPRIVDLHNYIPANSTQQKLKNWSLLNRKVFSKLDFQVPDETVKKIVLSTSGAVVAILNVLKEKIDRRREQTTNNNLEYYDARTLRKPFSEMYSTNPGGPSELMGMKKDERSEEKNLGMQQAAQLFSEMDPTLRLILQEKEQAMLALQETVEILQIKVNKLEHLVTLKDIRIEDLTRHLETYKAKDSTH